MHIGEEESRTARIGFAGPIQPHSPNSNSTSRPAVSDFPIVELKYQDRTKLVHLLSNYGYIIDWPEGRRPLFYVFDRKQRSRTRTDRWERFIQELKRLPDGIEIDAVRRCMVPFARGMPHSKSKELQKILDAKFIKRVSIDDRTKHVIFCSCETVNVRILYDDDRQKGAASDTDKPDR